MEVKQVFNAYSQESEASSRGSSAQFCRYCGQAYQKQVIDQVERLYCPSCSRVHYKNPLPAVSIIVEKEGKIVLGKRKKGSFQGGKWCLPCGYIEFNEDYLAAARREVWEETGLQVEIKSIISVMTNYFTPDLHSLVIVLYGKAVGGVLQAGDDIEEAAWVDPLDYEKEMAFEADVHIIRRYYEAPFEGAPVQKNEEKP